MAYNKARTEKEWLEWKNKEETQLRELGVDEDTIQFLHTYECFLLGKHTVERVCSGLSPLRRDRLWC